MFKMILAFVLLFAAFFIGITALTKTSKSDKRELLKIAGYSIVCSLLTFVVLTLIVLLF
jgi:hypothetical protein